MEKDGDTVENLSDTGAQHLTCPFCEVSGLQPFGQNSVRCTSCGAHFGGSLLDTLRQIIGLPDATGRHACECGHPEMRRLPDGVYRCPACGAEVLPLTARPVSWKSTDHSEAYWCGWLDGRFMNMKNFAHNPRLARWDSHTDRLDYYRGHRDGRRARAETESPLRKVS